MPALRTIDIDAPRIGSPAGRGVTMFAFVLRMMRGEPLLR
jgi:hypothetical protein